MADDSPTLSDFVEQLPQRLQRRFESLGGYVRGIIDDEEDQLGQKLKLSAEDIRFIQTAVFIYFLDGFLRAGSQAARAASTTFEEFGLSGFQVGSTVFTRNNDNTRRGEVLADRLRAALENSPLSKYISTVPTMRELVSRLIREMQNGKSVD